MLLGQADESDIPMGGESWRQGRMAMWKMQCTARLIALRCDGRCSVLRWPLHRIASFARECSHAVVWSVIRPGQERWDACGGACEGADCVFLGPSEAKGERRACL